MMRVRMPGFALLFAAAAATAGAQRPPGDGGTEEPVTGPARESATEPGPRNPEVPRLPRTIDGAVSIRSVWGDAALEIERALAREGFSPGEVDGVINDRTICALMAWQGANGIRATGRVDRPTALTLGVDFDTLYVATAGREGDGGESPPLEAYREDPRRPEPPYVDPVRPTTVPPTDPQAQAGAHPTQGSSMPTVPGDARAPVKTDSDILSGIIPGARPADAPDEEDPAEDEDPGENVTCP